MFAARGRSVHAMKEKRRRRAFLLRGALALAAAVAIGGALSAITRADALSIGTIEVKGAATVSAEEVKSLATEFLAGKYAYLFPKASALLYPAAALEGAIVARFPRVAAADARLLSPTALSISLTERTPHALLCSPRPEGEGEEGKEPTEPATPCYFLDETGFVFSKAPEFSGTPFFRYESWASAEDPVGTFFLPAERFRELDFFVASVRSAGTDPVSLALLPEGDVSLALSGGARILFSEAQDLAEVFENLQAVLSSEVVKEQGVLSLDYLDLRFGNKVFYKFK